jgi:aryl-alcohol dehydrogenase-like predicted oxidoreductase
LVKWCSARSQVRRVEEAIPAIHAGLDAGITFLDTADIYAPTWDAMGHNEEFVAEALRTWSGSKDQKDKVVIATKGGITRSEGEVWGRNGSLDYLLAATERSMKALGVDKIDLWQHHRLDPSIDFETQFENVLELKIRGLVDQIGVSNYDANQLKIALDIAGTPAEGGVVSIQNEFSPRYRYDLDVLEVCEEHEITFLPWSPLGGVQNQERDPVGFRIRGGIREALGVSPFATCSCLGDSLFGGEFCQYREPPGPKACWIVFHARWTSSSAMRTSTTLSSSHLPEQAEYSIRT